MAANAGIFYNNSNNTYCFNYKEADGVVISDGVVLKSTETIDHTQCDIFVIDEYGNVGWAPYYADADGLVAGTETWYNIYGTEIDGIVSSDNTDTTTYGKIVSAVTGFVPILVNGTVLSSYDNYVGHYTQSAVRQIFGVKADGTYLLLSGTWTMASAAAAALAEGCVFAYNFDGGGSAETVIGETVSSIGNNVDANAYSAVDFVEQSKGTRTLPTFMVFTSSDKVVSSATPASVSAVCSKTSYTSGIEIEDLFHYLTVTENFINANGNTSSRTIYSAQGVDKTVTLTNVVIGGASAVAACTEKTSGTAPNGTLYHTKSESEISSSLSSNSNTRESENYYDYSRGYTISTADDLTTSGSKTITVSYVPGDGLGALTTTFSISIATDTNSTSAATGNTSAASGSNCKIDGSHATINADVTDGKASFTVGSNVVSTLINNAQKTKNVLIEADAGSRAPLSVGVTIAASDVAAIASASDMALSIDTGIATISLSSAALTRMSGHALTVTAITNDDGTVTINVAADGDTQNAVSGGIHIAIPVESVSSTQVIVLVNEDGSETVLPKSMLDDEGNMAVTLIGSATIKITDNAKTFNDVIADNWSADSIAFVSSHELFNGVGNGIFERTATMNRGMLMTVLYRLEGQPDTAGSDVSFDDVPSDAFYADAVKWGVKMGITKGTDDGFNAESAITRQDLAVLLYRYAGTQGISSTDISGYSDVADVADYAQNALSWAVANGIINGTGAGLAPTGSATREQVAAMMTRLVQNVINN